MEACVDEDHDQLTHPVDDRGTSRADRAGGAGAATRRATERRLREMNKLPTTAPS
jgi:hypothetical protein